MADKNLMKAIEEIGNLEIGDVDKSKEFVEVKKKKGKAINLQNLLKKSLKN
ncbi:hypothetical protein [Marinitoga lauensis]|uniref:hypothetical protein n=1 Tax=Marinitoga lauensis TaxID=2201189 RepID=UPI001404EBBA|nr:hypothetical protein [Marinitoga lauensis]